MNLRQLFLQHLAQTSFSPLSLEIESGEGVFLTDIEGKKYLDLIAGIGVSVLGHRHPEVDLAVRRQLDKYWHTMVYGEFVLAPQVRLAERLAEVLPEQLNSVYFVNSGSEACEGAMKLAKRHTGRTEIISCKNAYHGSTQGAASLMWPTTFTQAFYPLLPGVRHIDYNCVACLEKITDKTAAVIVETVQAEWGVRRPLPGYLQALKDRCRQTGALLILDEVQAGYGRTGKLFAFENYEVCPDILLLAKGMGGGMPIGAFVAGADVMASLAYNPPLGHITTFGGHPVNCAAGCAVLDVLLSGNLIERVAVKEELFLTLLQHEAILDVRSAGLLMAVELKDFEAVQMVIQNCLDKGLITDWFLFNDRSLRIAPPLIIEEAEIKLACEIILESIEEAKL